MERIVLAYLSGSKANQEEKFPLRDFKEITLGRDPSSTVRFSEEAGTVVSRQHARITRNIALPSQFFITDLDSRNGTFINGQRIVGTVIIKPGDVVQCGAGGPEFRFSVEPETSPLTAETPAPTASLFGQSRAQPTSPDFTRLTSSISPVVTPARAPNAPVSAAQIEQLKTPAATRSRKPWIVGGGVLVVFTALAAGWLLYRGAGTTGSGEAGQSGAALQQGVLPNANPGKYDQANPSGEGAAEVEKDAERAAWRIEAAPYLVLGAGHPGKTASEFDKPDGVAFSPTGLLFATDAKNRRVQIWDVKTGTHLAEFGHGVFGGEIVDIATTPDNQVLITDQTLNLAYAFAPPTPGALDDKGRPLGPYDYQFKGTRFGEQGFKKLGGIAVDSRGRVYAVDAHRNDVHRFNPDGKLDKTWKFEKTRADGDTYLHGCEGVAIDEAAGNLFIASEKDAVIEVFDWETGAYKHQFVGAIKDASDKPAGKHVFFGSVEGLAIAQRHLLAVDESAGHIQIFDLARPDAFNTDLAGYASPQPNRPAGYRGFLGHAPLVNFEDKTNLELQKQVKTGAVIPGQSNPPGYFCSPDSIASYTDQVSGETYIAIADQCNYRLVVYRWSDIGKALGLAVAIKAPTPAANKTEAKSQAALPAVNKSAVAAKSGNAAPSRSKIASASASRPTSASASRPTSASVSRPTSVTGIKSPVKGADTAKAAGKGKKKFNGDVDPGLSGKKAKKAKKEKKVKTKP